MKITVDIPDSDMKEICFFTGEKKKGPAIRKLVSDALRLKRRQELAQRYVSGEWGVNLETFEAAQSQDKETAHQHDRAWRQ